MATTTTQAIPYAGPNDAPDVPYWQQRQAERTDVLVTGLDTRLDTAEGELAALPTKLASGTGSIAITTTQTSVTQTVTLPAGFARAPEVFVQFHTNAGGRALQLRLDTYSTTTTSFTVKLSTADVAQIGSSYTIYFNWMAVA